MMIFRAKFSFGVMLLLFSAFYSEVYGQKISYEVNTFSFKKVKNVSPRSIQQDWLFQLQNLEAPFEGNSTYKSYWAEVKSEVERKYGSKSNIVNQRSVQQVYQVDSPIVVAGFEGNNYGSGVPNDNTMAISNDGIVISAINTNIIFYDTKTDSLLKTISLMAFTDTLSGVASHQYDPKVIYDYQQDKFILVYLAGSNGDATSHVIVAFSTTNNPMDDWHLYAVEGNPFNDTSWTDYPALSLSEDELFITGNLLLNGSGSWQILFKQSIIWQINKEDGYQGKDLQPQVISGIGYGDTRIRNIHPMSGGNYFLSQEMYFLSQRNFDIENDTFFLMKVGGLTHSSSHYFEMKALLADKKYGMPPNAHQPNGRKLATNDSRVLGGFYQNGHIQFVGNTVDTLTGHASFYHGIIEMTDLSRKIKLQIFSDTVLEYGYPNLSYCGTHGQSRHSIISVNYGGAAVFPGLGAFFYEADDLYSPMIRLKKGNTSIKILFGLQRWGDYSASQPKYNSLGEVWVSGTFGKKIGNLDAYGTWISALRSSVKDLPEVPQGEVMVSKVYPNPSAQTNVTIDFTLLENTDVEIQLFNSLGALIGNLYHGNAKKGRNLLSFSTQSLQAGIYYLNIKTSDNLVKMHKLTVL